MELLKMLSTNEMVAQLLSFLALLFLLRIFAWKKLLKLLDDRRDRIAAEFKSIEDSKADVEKMKGEYARMLDEAEDAAKAKIREAIAEGGKLGEEIKKQAAADAERLIEEARGDIRRELVRVKDELYGEVTDIVLDAAGRLLEQKIDSEKDRHLVSDFLKEIEGKP
jgi:F-type H+-transporting ATPase subunit b